MYQNVIHEISLNLYLKIFLSILFEYFTISVQNIYNQHNQ